MIFGQDIPNAKGSVTNTISSKVKVDWSETLNLPIDKWHQCCHNRLLTFVWGVPWVHEEDYEAKESQEHRKQEFDVQLQ